MSDGGLNNKSFEDLLKEAKDISYVLNGNSRIKIKNNTDAAHLVLLYDTNLGQKKGDKVLFYKEKDKDGLYFIRLTSYGSSYIKKHEMFSETKKHDVKGYQKALKFYSKIHSTDSSELENNVDNSIKQEVESKKKSRNLRDIIFSKESDYSDEKTGQLVCIQYNPLFYGEKTDYFKQFILPKQ
ncbi:MAG TPA: hypothetical protein VEC16_06720 [Alphaproteobacteria bacterium]|nr:hypothetical protein [Alphaproteobacteria bacterium]